VNEVLTASAGPGRTRAQEQSGDFYDRPWLSWLIKVRIIIITFLLGIELAITNLTPTGVNKMAFVAVVVLCYTIALFYAVLLWVWRDLRLQPKVQVLTDLGMATALVYVTGGIDSSFNFLFPLIIIIGSILLTRSWAFLTASLAFIFHGGMLELSYFGVIKSYTLVKPDLRSLQATILINLFAYSAIAYLASRLSTKLRQVDVELKDKSGELEDLQALHENIVQSINTGLVTANLDGRIRVVNSAAASLLGKAADELIGMPVANLFLDRLPEPGSSNTHGEVRILVNSGKHRQKTFGITAAVLSASHSGASAGYVYMFEDLTEIRRLEREVRLRDRLAAVGRMAAGIAHEIRNPLSSIAGSVKVLSEVAALDDEQKVLVNIVNRESERLNNIISDFLMYTREKQYEFAHVDLIPLLEDTLTLLENRQQVGEESETAKVKIIRDFSVPKAITVADRDRLKQVFWNISDNAMRAMPEGGTLTVSLEEEDSSFAISFTDTGKGMVGTQIEKMFEPFQSDFAGGTGLGLAIVYQIIQAHDGKISVRSAMGEGAEFIIRLKRSAEPVSEEEAPAQIAAAASVGSGKGQNG